ncbi:hypothetical protein E2C01_070283 [Portunus trituberculatus]|uniref:Uncharacterized protein n=1 Tax=Portunus trituberculatus TaxID=210409 RepID=A0A5B7I1P2_PORTR|nr:hypothetical protein [Portunus trituberculatus]
MKGPTHILRALHNTAGKRWPRRYVARRWPGEVRAGEGRGGRRKNRGKHEGFIIDVSGVRGLRGHSGSQTLEVPHWVLNCSDVYSLPTLHFTLLRAEACLNSTASLWIKHLNWRCCGLLTGLPVPQGFRNLHHYITAGSSVP